MKSCFKFLTLTLLICLIIFFSSYKKTVNHYNDIELNGSGCLILCYHRVLPKDYSTKLFYKIVTKYTDDNELNIYSVLGEDFENQIKFLKDNGANFLTPDELKFYISNKITIPEKSVIITFDDVDESVYKNAFPILQKNKIPFTLFIITGRVGDKNFKGLRLCDWDMIKEMYQSNLVTVGTHTHNMHYLDKKNNPPFIKTENVNLFVEDTIRSQETINNYLGFSPKYFSYPYGFGIPETDEKILKVGFELIFTLNPGIVKSDDPSFCIKRVLVNKYTWSDIEKWVLNRK
ncbi:hypothetical protein Q428_01020 [Fervidicella metallireducens AeB]|uniref:NodB homology domain-containing protein n=1 Tax=Fervidicella metallireducens AeB TaxID=1403537 RepID=A0A017RYQ2_9CLOT|nr:polysaccharide deacetylase family protein [Fervidicella metallireducens]EYE89716.1 hypothetical protein Q428_01020 [Fervidicella metallireducens AeB]